MAKAATEKATPGAWTRATLPRVALIAGPEATLREEAITAIKKAAFAGAPENVVTMHGTLNASSSDALTPAMILDEACMKSMFAVEGEVKIVLVRSADAVLGENFRIFEDNFDSIPDDTTLVFEASGFGKLKATNFYKKLAAKGAIIECGSLAGDFGDTSALEQEVDKRARAMGLRLAHGALVALVGRSAKNLGVIEEELNKLALSLKPAGTAAQSVDVTEHDIEELCARTGTATAFQFVDALLDGNARQALETLGMLFDRGISNAKKPGKLITQEDAIVMIVLGALTYKLALLQDVRAAIDSGKNEYSVLGEMKIFGRRGDDIKRSLRRHSDASLRQAMEALFLAYLNLRRGGGVEPRAVMEELVFKCAKTH